MFLYEAFILGLLGSCIGGVLSFAGGYIAVSVMLQDASYLFYPETLFYIPPYDGYRASCHSHIRPVSGMEGGKSQPD